jgi:putative pyrroloquinoline-quinone binding quinoprotein
VWWPYASHVSQPAVIDLDVVRAASGVARPAARPPGARARWLSAVLVAVSVLWLGAAGPPGPDLAPEHLIGGVFERLVLDPVRAFTVRNASASSRIDAYALGDGTHLWSTAVRGTVLRMLADSGVLLVSADDTVALDAATGRVRWRQRAASLLGNAAGLAVVTTVPGVFGGLDLRTGEPRWAADISANARTVVQYEAGKARIVEMADWYPDGTLDLRDPVTGELRRHVQIGRGADSVSDAYLVGGTLLLGETESAGIRWYNGENGNPGSLPKLGYTVTSGMVQCGTNVCVGDNGGLTAIDLARGQAVWHVKRWNVYRGLTPSVAEVFDATGVDAGDTGALIDPVTGRILDGLAGWQPTDATLGPQAALWHRMPAGGELLAVHNGQTGLRLVVGRVSRWQSAPTCELNAAFLACYGGEEMAVWRLPAPV